MRARNFYAVIVMLCVTIFHSCKKDDTSDNGKDKGDVTVNMHLKDGPGRYDAVWLNIQQVVVTMEGRSAVELTPVRPGMYDILRFRNGLDTLLLRAILPAGRINQIRLILGDGNLVVVDGEPQPLTTPSAQESGLKLNLKENFVAGGSYDIWIDFDASKSIHQTGNGKYMLKPVIRAYSTLTDGRIKGYVFPAIALPTVYVTNGTDVYSAIPDADGYFMITGLPEGAYKVTFDATLPVYIDHIIDDVQVTYGVTTDLETTTLLQ